MNILLVALLAGADGADDALRTLLDAGLHGPLGMADTAQWATGAAGPTDVPAYQDNWNMVLSTMGLVEWAASSSRTKPSTSGGALGVDACHKPRRTHKWVCVISSVETIACGRR